MVLSISIIHINSYWAWAYKEKNVKKKSYTTDLIHTYSYIQSICILGIKGNYENGATFKCASTLVTKIIINNNSQSNFDFTYWV